MEFNVFHAEEFESPGFMYFYSVSIIATQIITVLTLMFSLLEQDTAVAIIHYFVRFKILIKIQDYYLKCRENFSIKGATADGLTITRNHDKIFGSKE